jgi:hypothetical protein
MFDQGQMPMTSYANNNALAGLAGNFGGGGWQGFGKLRGMMGGAPGMQPPMPPGTPPAPVDPALQQPSALGAFGQPAPLTIGPQGIPQQFQDWRQQMQDWRGLRPDRPDFQAMRGSMDPGAFRDARQDWRGDMRDWRGQRPQFGNWR